MSRWRHFTLTEFACKHCGLNGIDLEFVDRLDELRERVGFPLRVNSGFRCPDHNAAVSTTGHSGPHTTGKAVDLSIERGQAYQVLAEAMTMGFSGIGVKQHGMGRYLHLDDLPAAEGRPRPTIWSYP